MSVNAKLLEILQCPVSSVGLGPLATADLQRLNQQITDGDVVYVDGEPLTEPLAAALITDNRKVIYPIIDGLPALLPDRGIGTTQLEGFD